LPWPLEDSIGNLEITMRWASVSGCIAGTIKLSHCGLCIPTAKSRAFPNFFLFEIIREIWVDCARGAGWVEPRRIAVSLAMSSLMTESVIGHAGPVSDQANPVIDHYLSGFLGASFLALISNERWKNAGESASN
jgi:hypothetical protein